MKKLLMILAAIPALIFMASCDHDDDLPNVTVSYDYSNATEVDDILYVVEGDTLTIDSVAVTPAQGTKDAQILSVLYRFNGYMIANVPFSPFGVKIPTANLEPGKYVLGMEIPIAQVDKTPATAYIRTLVQVVDDPADIPSATSPQGLGAGTYVTVPDLQHR